MFDAHLVARGLSDQDLETLAAFGVRAALVPARAPDQGGTVKAARREWDDVVQRQLPRLERAGLRGYAALGVEPGAIPHKGLRELLAALPSHLSHPRVVAVGALGLARGTALELEALDAQLALARDLNLPVVLCAGARARVEVLRRMLRHLKAAGFPRLRALVDGCDGKTLQAVRALGHWAGLSLHPDLLSAERAAELVARVGTGQLVLDTRAGDGASDLLALARARRLLERSGLSAAVVDKVTGANAAALLGVDV